MWRVLVCFGLVVLAGSCVSKRELTYFNRKPLRESVAPQHDYKLRSGDDVFIEIKSPDPSSSSFYNLKGDEYSGPYNDAFVYLNSHSVNPNGNVELPFIGAIEVQGLTIQQTIRKIEIALTEHLRDATIFAKLVSYDVTVLGEVNKPGNYTVHDNMITIFQALGMAGDLTNYGKRNKIKVIRNENGIDKTHIVNLNNNSIMTSECYFIYPHDVIYVAPMRTRSTEINVKPISVVLSGAAVFLLIIRTIQE